MSYLTEERTMIQNTARDFAMKEVLPIANKLDPVEGDMPMELRNKMGELGYFGILIPEEYGGLGLGCFEYALVAEELARGWMSVASIIARGNGIWGATTEEQKRKYFPKMARGEFLGAFSLSEPDAGSDLAAVSCRATRDGDDYVINGTKTWCTFADGADFIHLFARTSPPEGKRRHVGITQFLIEKERGSLPPGCSGTPIRKIGYFGWRTWELHFDNCRIPATTLIGEEGRGFYTMMAFLEVARVHTAARAIGLSRGALEDSLTYATRRSQFKRPIAEFQAIRFKLAEMAANIEAARQLMYAVATDVDSKRRCDKEASMVKWFATEMAERVTSDALQIHGGYGYTKDLPIERYWRDARLTKIFEGTSQIQLRIISDRLLGGMPE
ncbi:MAG: acyl-CoA dehydrogenase family protein [Candidatus Binataceae bacterium]